MGIKLFIFALFFVAIAAHLFDPEIKISDKVKQERPLVTFKDATMYTVDEIEVKRIVQADIAAIFKKREELYEAFIVERVRDSEKEEFTDTLKANFIEKKLDFVTMRGDVIYNRSSIMTLNSNELFYDMKKKIGYNNKPFEMTYEGQKLVGSDIYFDADKKVFEAKNTHFEIETKDNNETN